MLEVKDLKKKFVKYNANVKKEEFYADNGISFKAKDGEIIGILDQMGQERQHYLE